MMSAWKRVHWSTAVRARWCAVVRARCAGRADHDIRMARCAGHAGREATARVVRAWASKCPSASQPAGDAATRASSRRAGAGTPTTPAELLQRSAARPAPRPGRPQPAVQCQACAGSALPGRSTRRKSARMRRLPSVPTPRQKAPAAWQMARGRASHCHRQCWSRARRRPRAGERHRRKGARVPVATRATLRGRGGGATRGVRRGPKVRHLRCGEPLVGVVAQQSLCKVDGIRSRMRGEAFVPRVRHKLGEIVN